MCCHLLIALYVSYFTPWKSLQIKYKYIIALCSKLAFQHLERMQLKNLVLLIFWFLLISLNSISGQEFCFNEFFKSNSTYDLNRHQILSSLASNVSTNNGFFNSSIGQNPNRMFIIGMCIPKTEPDRCSDCIRGASESLLKSCPNETDAYTWPDLCMVRYSKDPFSGSLIRGPSQVVPLSTDINVDLTEFDRVWKELMLRTITAASNGTSSVGQKYYAAQVASLSAFQTMYVMMQCTPDVSSRYCEFCLKENVHDFESCCRGKGGGAVVRPICFIRWDLYPFAGAFEKIALPPPPPPPQSLPQPPLSSTPVRDQAHTKRKGIVLAIIIPTVVILVLVVFGFAVFKRRKSYQTSKARGGDQITRTHSLQFSFKTIEAATNMFSYSNMIGKGGFGEVYRGTLSNGTEVAIKRLSKTSGQGTQEFKNEAVLVAKLQHRNLVRLLGFCLEGEEKILVYEFVANKSLDSFLFDPKKKVKLDWRRRYNIIVGIARGILYLHQDSRLTIIHRDLKASNILLDADMNPKIADFGMSRIFGVDQSQANTIRIVGTYGYMSPEYAMRGHFSVKSDVYSFGVMLLEIISGKGNSSFYHNEDSPGNLVTHAWRLWRNKSPLELVDPTIGERYKSEEVTRCIHIALLCVQKNPEDRPMLSVIIGMLTSSDFTLRVPRAPGFNLGRSHEFSSQTTEMSIPGSVNGVSITDLDPR